MASLKQKVEVVNSLPDEDALGQVWKWNEEFIVSKLGDTFALDGSFGKISLKKMTNGNIYQKWRSVTFNVKK